MEIGGEITLNLEYNNRTKQLSLRGYALPKAGRFSDKEKRDSYLEEAIKIANVPDSD